MHTSTARIGLTLVFVAASAVGISHIQADRGAKALHRFELPPTSLTNFGYTQAELDLAAPFGLTVDDQPAIGSGLILLQGNEYLGITDRGPNFDHFSTPVGCTPSGSSNGKTHPLPQFTPAIMRFRTHGGVIEPLSIVNLVAPGGTGITGLSNFFTSGDNTTDDLSFTDPCEADSVLNENGMDVEDFALLPNGKFIGVEENRPSVFIGDLATGVIEMRYIPKTQNLPSALYTVNNTVLPEVLKRRSKNRGFEGIAVSPDRQTAYTMTQSPLEVGCSGGNSVCRNGRVLRILKLDVSNPYSIFVTGQYVFRMSNPAVYPSGNTARTLKLSAMAWVGPNKLLLLERSDETGIGGVRLILVDLEGATDIHGLYDASLVPEETAGSPGSPNPSIDQHVSSQVVFEEFENQTNRIFWTYKLEGLAIRNANTVDIINDNDFGIASPPNVPTNLWTLKLPGKLPLGQ
jgi:hypothetical protein